MWKALVVLTVVVSLILASTAGAQWVKGFAPKGSWAKVAMIRMHPITEYKIKGGHSYSPTY